MKVLGIALLLIASLSMAPAHAVETGLSIYPKGFAGFMAGAVPPPGFYATDIYYYFHGGVAADVRNGQTELGAGVTMNANFLQGTWVSENQFLGGSYAASGAIAVANGSLHAQLDTPIGTADIHASNSGLADSILTPVLLGWSDGNLHWNAGLTFYIPTGDYSSTGLSLGRNIWGFMPAFSITWFEPTSGWDISSAFTYVTMTRNDATDYQSGDLLHADWALGHKLGEGGAWELGIQGNVVQQIGGDRGSGAKLGPLQAESLGIGPAISYSTKAGSTPMVLNAKWEHDIDAHNTFGGDAIVLSATAAF